MLLHSKNKGFNLLFQCQCLGFMCPFHMGSDEDYLQHGLQKKIVININRFVSVTGSKYFLHKMLTHFITEYALKGYCHATL